MRPTLSHRAGPRSARESSGSSARSARDTRRALLEAGTRLFAQRGYDGTSVREIADAARVNLALVSYHFAGKEGLYAACIEPYGRAELEVARTVLRPENAALGPERFRETLIRFLVDQAHLRLLQPELAMIVNRECDGGIPIAEKLFRDTFLESVNLLREFLELGKQHGILRPQINALHAAGLLYGAMAQVLRSARLAAKFHQRDLSDAAFRRRVFTDWIDMLWQGIQDQAPVAPKAGASGGGPRRAQSERSAQPEGSRKLSRLRRKRTPR